ncbi:flagellar protein FliT [Gammaproteobacteria bacterium 53_120_T64]|nr:flagellar protein FliT [Gammaproteobacteria bacterium 53_120_T64]
MFFTDQRRHFFKPLTGKYREQLVQCLCLLYQRQYSSTADYGQALSREQILALLTESLARPVDQVFDDEPATATGDELEPRFKNHREQANWALKQLVEGGWLERQVDAATLYSSFPFTRLGRVFAQALLEADSTQIRTRHRNTRNTLNALEALLSRGEVYDLLDAYEYSERIITDFTDVIAELDERKRELIREVESQQLVQQAAEQFFEFMEKRFQPDIAVRLSADSVEKHREDISRVVAKIRRKSKGFKQEIERSLRRTVPGLCGDEQSYLWFILDTIEQRMRNAADIMLPALRSALHGFTKRADIIIRQLSYMNSCHNNDLLAVCAELADVSDDQYRQRMAGAADSMASFNLALIDPQQIKLQDRQTRPWVDNALAPAQSVDAPAQRELLIRQLLDQAFMTNNGHLKDYVLKAMHAGQRISTRSLPVDDAHDLLAMAHIIEVGALNNLSSELRFRVEATGRRVEDSAYYRGFDEFTIELLASSAETHETARSALAEDAIAPTTPPPSPG